ncbi:MAG: hypothetical protein J0L92_40950 [Deltaproteobacteria bacterium]|nr:hypothetical protein [Deltaproteobacteria bacterium]
MRSLVPAIVAVAIFSTGIVRAQAAEDTSIATPEAPDEAVPAAPSSDTDFDVAIESEPLDASEAEDAQALADPFGLELRAHELDAILAADANGAQQARTFSAVMGYIIAAIGIGATPVFFALDDGSGLYPILSILPLQLGALSLATAILGSVTISTEERRYAEWRRLSAEGRPDLGQIGRHEGYLVADADRARDARLFSLAQGISGIATGVFTGIVGVALSRVELTQITLGTLGAVELLLGALQLLGALDAGEIESRPARYETRTGVRLSLRADGIAGEF